MDQDEETQRNAKRAPRMIRILPPPANKPAVKCRHPHCAAMIWFGKTVAGGKLMVLELPIAPAETFEDPTLGRIWLVPDTQVHWLKCPGAQDFRKRR